MNRVFNRTLHRRKTRAWIAVGEIIKALEAGQHVVLSFGKNESDLDYLLVSNLLTRRIRGDLGEARPTNSAPTERMNRVRW